MWSVTYERVTVPESDSCVCARKGNSRRFRNCFRSLLNEKFVQNTRRDNSFSKAGYSHFVEFINRPWFHNVQDGYDLFDRG